MDATQTLDLNTALDRTVLEHGTRAALAFPAGDGTDALWTYDQLRDKVLRAAAVFRRAGIGRGDRVAILHRNDPAFITAYFGLTRLGAVAVPINFMIQNPEELRYMLDHCGAKGLVTQNDLLPGVRAARTFLPSLASVWTTDMEPAEDAASFWPALAAHGPLPAAAEAQVEPDETVAILYTSGTTGVPKGVMMTHRNLVSNCAAAAERLRMSADDVAMAVLPMFHTFCWTCCVLTPLTLGGKIVIGTQIAPPLPWLEAAGRHGATILAAVPPVWVLLSKNAVLQAAIRERGLFARVRLCISGAAPLSTATHDDMKRAFGLEITEGYGLTETSPVATMNVVGAPRVGSVGLPVSGVAIRLAADGEVEIKGPNVMKGYFQDPEATAAAIDEDGWFKSGDLGSIDEDGALRIHDRKKDMIIVKGLKVFSAQVEKALLTHPDAREAAVIGVPDAAGDERVKAFVVLAEGSAADTAALHRHCRENLDAYKRPREIEVVAELPKNAMKKTLKRLLREREVAKRSAA
ncbi:MAG: AMP-binding protein [Elusimicrobia bacterium]|nr:AMP-binding protein [Elusimicrobiota bacterium]